MKKTKCEVYSKVRKPIKAPNFFKCPNCGRPVIVEAMCFDCATAYQKGKKEGTKQELEKIVRKFSNLKYSRIDMIEYVENQLEELK